MTNDAERALSGPERIEAMVREVMPLLERAFGSWLNDERAHADPLWAKLAALRDAVREQESADS